MKDMIRWQPVIDNRTQPQRALSPIERFWLDWQPARFDLSPWPSASWHRPGIEYSETDDAYIAKVAVPGLKAHEIDITVAGNQLSISGQMKRQERGGNEGSFKYEQYASFNQWLTLPAQVDKAATTAALEDGILTIHMPKSQRSAEQIRRIPVGQSGRRQPTKRRLTDHLRRLWPWSRQGRGA